MSRELEPDPCKFWVDLSASGVQDKFLLGKGAFANVYKVESKDGKQYALRVSKLETATQRYVAGNEREITQGLLGEPWVAQTVAQHTCKVGQRDYFVQLQSLYDGNLLQYFEKLKHLPDISILNRLVFIGTELGSLGLVNADSKPDNYLYRVLPDATLDIVMTDFGHATILTAQKPILIGWAITEWKCGDLKLDLVPDDKELLLKTYLFAIFFNVLTISQALMQRGVHRWLDTSGDEEQVVWSYRLHVKKGMKFFQMMLKQCPNILASYNARVQKADALYKANGQAQAMSWITIDAFETNEAFKSFLERPEWN
jgi:hypothetical protein